MTIDLRTCQVGQKVERGDGTILEYKRREEGRGIYQHKVGEAWYTNGGRFVTSIVDEVLDIARIIPLEPANNKHPSVAAWESFPWITDRVPTKEDSMQHEFQYSVLTLANGMIYVYDCEHIKLGAKWMHLPGWAPPKLTPQEEALALLEGKDDNWVPSAEEWLVFRKAIKP